MIRNLVLLAALVGFAVASAGPAAALEVRPEADILLAGGKCNGTLDTDCTCTDDLNGCIKGETCRVYLDGRCYVG